MFDWVRFLSSHRIEYKEERRDNVKIKCPFCGDDPSEHMGISLTGAGWNCWRNKSHRSKSPVGLIQVLLRCSWEQAREIAGYAHYVPDDACGKAMALLRPPAPPKRKPLRLPPEFLDLHDVVRVNPYIRYLEARGFTALDAERHYLQYCISGPYRGRIIFPVQFGGRLVSWTGRHIGRSELRYKSHTHDPERAKDEGYEPALGPINHYLLWYDGLLFCRAHTLVICEGPMDAFKVSVLGTPQGITATCLFGAEPTDAQIDLLHELTPKFTRTVLLLDRGTVAKTTKVTRELKALGVEARFMKLRKDPGELRSMEELIDTLH